jgi:YfiH family protein
VIGSLSRTALPPGALRSLLIEFPPYAGQVLRPRAFLSLRSSGDMPFGSRGEGAREKLFAEAGIDPSSVRGLALAHSRRVLVERGKIGSEELARRAAQTGGADGLLLFDETLVASVTVADCMPIWILDGDSGAFGVLHSGWKGTGILAEAVRVLSDLCGSRPQAISAILGPAIGSCCYDVDQGRAAAFATEFGAASVERRGEGWRLDLRAANLALASSLGLGSVLSIEACTSCDDRLGSFRREGTGAFTRMVAACGRFPGGSDL